LFLQFKGSAFAAGFFQQANFFNNHTFVQSFTHVIKGQSRHRNSCQRLHFDPGLTGQTHGRRYLHGLLLGQQLEIHRRMGNGQGVAQRNEVRSSLGSHNPGKTRGFEHVALGNGAALDLIDNLGCHPDNPPGNGFPGGLRLAGHIDHPDPTVTI